MPNEPCWEKRDGLKERRSESFLDQFITDGCGLLICLLRCDAPSALCWIGMQLINVVVFVVNQHWVAWSRSRIQRMNCNAVVVHERGPNGCSRFRGVRAN